MYKNKKTGQGADLKDNKGPAPFLGGGKDVDLW
jgi:hypothetical protein